MTAWIPSFGRTQETGRGVIISEEGELRPRAAHSFWLAVVQRESIPWATTPLVAKLKDYTLFPPVLFPGEKIEADAVPTPQC